MKKAMLAALFVTTAAQVLRKEIRMGKEPVRNHLKLPASQPLNVSPRSATERFSVKRVVAAMVVAEKDNA